jgi:putative two-component system response regulator
MTDLSTILIIDDSFENLHLMSSLLRTQYRILTATSGEIGLLVASKQPSPDLIARKCCHTQYPDTVTH